ncbi:MAG: NifU family protein [Phycisphaerae bacterium]|nr:NifU family protein [Phycisphaerae bacterium]
MKDKVAGVIDQIRPALQRDGGDIELVDVTADGVVSVRLQGACSGCPSAAMTLSMLVERKLKADVPEVTELVSIP